MANSRLERIGTIYSRVTGLLRSGAMKPENKPIWYEVYQSFPPKYQPKFDRPVPNMEIQKIFYPEDELRARIKKEKPGLINQVNLSDTSRLSNTQKLIAYYEELKEEMFDKEAYEKAVERVVAELPVRRQESVSPAPPQSTTSVAEDFKQSKKVLEDIFK